MYRNPTIYHLLGISMPTMLFVRNNAKCTFVPETTNSMYTVFRDIASDSDNEAIKHFAEELEKAIKNYQGDCFCVPVYLPTQECTGKITCGERLHPTNYRKTACAWNRRISERGFKLGNYYQFVLWMATIISHYSDEYHVSIREALESVLKPVDELNDIQWTRRIMWSEDENDTKTAIVTGFDPDKYCMNCGTMLFAKKIYHTLDVTATPFIIAQYY